MKSVGAGQHLVGLNCLNLVIFITCMIHAPEYLTEPI